MNCPKCGENNTRLSRRSTWRDLLHKVASQRAWRCRNCKERFYARGGAEVPAVEAAAPKQRTHSKSKQKRKTGQPRLSKRTQTRLVEAGLFVGMLVVFYFFLRYLTQERLPTGESNYRTFPNAAISS